MNIETEHRDDILILRPLGRLDSSNSPELEQLLSEHLDAGCQRLVLDFSGLSYISSAGLRVVLLAGKKLRASKGKIVLTSLQDMVRDVFDMSGFLTLFAVADTLDEGVAKV
ncbi:STAS domain-containing protein [Acidovorax sp. CCYZU-2555]|uniref:STAS domain-containing protein n=1 Tax=Acidovorax sp. CCYZU-2555 TaxID=2835042 RepID=UPI001BCFFABD|nr:STAS domain-containing protein [Acidovorax sp. CCYZU-2555]MBS7777606.1 STAS domain-containing protein [Acidovorax sp. CCYZU-2555]